jgi:hypothetical protein
VNAYVTHTRASEILPGFDDTIGSPSRCRDRGARGDQNSCRTGTRRTRTSSHESGGACRQVCRRRRPLVRDDASHAAPPDRQRPVDIPATEIRRVRQPVSRPIPSPRARIRASHSNLPVHPHQHPRARTTSCAIDAQAHRPAEHPHPRLRAHRHRLGGRVRLQRHASRARPPRRGISRDPGR